jgi:TetR/AcrR family transcriptional regulator, fatty acid metabolism regulator protein
MSRTDIKRERILEAAISVFSKEGYHNSKITKIAELSGVAAGSVYLYFDNKEHLLQEVFVRAWSKIQEKLVSLIEDNKITNKVKIEKFVIFITELVFESRNLASMILHEHRFWSSGKNKKLIELVNNSINSFKMILIEGIKSGEFRSTLMPSVATAFIIGALWHQLAYWAEHFQDFSLEIMKAQAIDLVLSSIK